MIDLTQMGKDQRVEASRENVQGNAQSIKMHYEYVPNPHKKCKQ